MQDYCTWSDQLVNKSKCSIHFRRPNTLPEVRAAIIDELQLQPMKKNIKYLGPPLFWGRDKAKHFSLVKERIQSKLSGWKCKTLSQAGLTTLFKSVVTTLPQYFMQSLHFPAGWCSQVDKLVKDFWWGFPTNKSHNYTPKAWHSICQPKLFGGLGIRRIKEINLAFSAKAGMAYPETTGFSMGPDLEGQVFPKNLLP